MPRETHIKRMKDVQRIILRILHCFEILFVLYVLIVQSMNSKPSFSFVHHPKLPIDLDQNPSIINPNPQKLYQIPFSNTSNQRKVLTTDVDIVKEF